MFRYGHRSHVLIIFAERKKGNYRVGRVWMFTVAYAVSLTLHCHPAIRLPSPTCHYGGQWRAGCTNLTLVSTELSMFASPLCFVCCCPCSSPTSDPGCCIPSLLRGRLPFFTFFLLHLHRMLVCLYTVVSNIWVFLFSFANVSWSLPLPFPNYLLCQTSCKLFDCFYPCNHLFLL
jgi:hypothetical protein